MVPKTVCSIRGVTSTKNSAPSTWMPESVNTGAPKAIASRLAMAKPIAAGCALMSIASPLSATLTTVLSMMEPSRSGTVSPTSALLGIVISSNEATKGVATKSAEKTYGPIPKSMGAVSKGPSASIISLDLMVSSSASSCIP